MSSRSIVQISSLRCLCERLESKVDRDLIDLAIRDLQYTRDELDRMEAVSGNRSRDAASDWKFHERMEKEFRPMMHRVRMLFTVELCFLAFVAGAACGATAFYKIFSL